MKANEFVKEYGIDIARECLEERPKGWQSCYLKLSNFELVKYIPSPLDFIDIDDLKHLIESHELVEKLGGLSNCKKLIIDYGRSESADHLSYHVANVESCQ